MVKPQQRSLQWVLSMCDSRKYPYSPHRRDWKFRRGGGGGGGGGVSKRQKFIAMSEAKLEFPEGLGGHWGNVFCGGIWIFSGTTQSFLLKSGGGFNSLL